MLLESQKGKKKLAYQGYMYLVHSTRANGSLRWRCADSKKYKCYGSIQTDANCGSIEITNSHVHVADRAAVDVAVCRNRMRARAKTSRDKPGVIYVEALQHLPTTARAQLPSAQVVKRCLRNYKTVHHPPVPNSIVDLRVEGAWSTTGGVNPQPFMQYDSVTDTSGIARTSASRVIVFATTECLRILGTANKWFMDGNFAIALHQFKQVCKFIKRHHCYFTVALCLFHYL